MTGKAAIVVGGACGEVASLVAYLARPESSFVTGSAITIDGGYLA